ncbi:MAG: GvpL/GvpF family gas vesicle protein [Pseudomonadota bacterium]
MLTMTNARPAAEPATLRAYAVMRAETKPTPLSAHSAGDAPEALSQAWRVEAAGLALWIGDDPAGAAAVTGTLAAMGPVLPAGREFPAFASSRAAQRWLEQRAAPLRERLEWIGERAEFLVTIRNSAPIDLERAPPPQGLARLAALATRRAGETMARAAFRPRAEAASREVESAFRAAAAAFGADGAADIDCLRSPAAAGGLDLAILCPAPMEIALAAVLRTLEGRLGEGVALRGCGPWPAYSFARLAFDKTRS